MNAMDQVTARALTEAGFMPLSSYLEMFADFPTPQDEARVDDPHDSILDLPHKWAA